ncbi:MAG: hypothetical protein H7301_14580 [Cryobacterium sp.]|nr:hypothetical protein [Oligoflexia bacterium]
MTANPKDLDFLSKKLWEKGVAAFTPTTLSATPADLLAAVGKLGSWIRSGSAPGAVPLGIHLEGPFISPGSAGAHTKSILRPLGWKELGDLWDASLETLKIITLAPETLPEPLRIELGRWAQARKIRLSIGHTRCTERQAELALRQGFTGVTHAWNAMTFHHRDTGALGAAFGNPKVRVEIIPDGIHVSDETVGWSLRLHPEGLFFVSDATPAAGTRGGGFSTFGDLRCRLFDGASRLANGTLAGGGRVLSETFADWVTREAQRLNQRAEKILTDHLARVQEIPLDALFFKRSEKVALLSKFPVGWEISGSGKVKCVPGSAG